MGNSSSDCKCNCARADRDLLQDNVEPRDNPMYLNHAAEQIEDPSALKKKPPKDLSNTLPPPEQVTEREREQASDTIAPGLGSKSEASDFVQTMPSIKEEIGEDSAQGSPVVAKPRKSLADQMEAEEEAYTTGFLARREADIVASPTSLCQDPTPVDETEKLAENTDAEDVPMTGRTKRCCVIS
mmetsp:Transcript_94957/g.150092  ORF Transcript_94957/g.150092 Transcript_94957/m.150092 type:complete len:184 (+) Transcript_94957:116-667(+)|eukprot:CAMPEP_0169269400 /NCGR_PEP_ID=MMETSP1016-20121227/48418_1 /TAXON_ID=342587 /ORGANISM="Karlodinium micrum, Strain CCMP2283" /LENGTH=183 /DNA_ID=CAMNT_0009354385 /DNA_START=13 /DNA_END=564 /DNA_ORIENTATION=+